MENGEKRVKRIGFWINEKKCKKFDVPEFVEACRKLNMEVVKLDLLQPLQPQGPFDVILHKMTAVYAQALDGGLEARLVAENFEKYLSSVPSVPVVDPVAGVHTLLHRPATYALLQALTREDDQVMTPPYVELADTDIWAKKQKLAAAGVTFPIVCKPVFGCGGTAAHELAVVLSAGRLAEWRGPCVAQSFVPHGAVLYKLYVLGSSWYLVVRPSLKNFKATDAPTVHFNSAKVSKAGSCSPLTQLDQSDMAVQPPQPDDAVFDSIVRRVRHSLSMNLLGIDVVINSSTGQYAIIDVNPFPSYDSITDLMPRLAGILQETILFSARDHHAWNTSSISTLLPPLQRRPDGSRHSPRTLDSSGIDIARLLMQRGHLVDTAVNGVNGARESSNDSNGVDVHIEELSIKEKGKTNGLQLVEASNNRKDTNSCTPECRNGSAYVQDTKFRDDIPRMNGHGFGVHVKQVDNMNGIHSIDIHESDLDCVCKTEGYAENGCYSEQHSVEAVSITKQLSNPVASTCSVSVTVNGNDMQLR